MPTYEYKCLDCGQRFELFQSMKDDALDVCDECKGRLKRLIGAGAGIIFKGTGFYCTDYKKNGVSPSSDEGAESTTSKPAATASSAEAPAAGNVKEKSNV